MRTNIALLSILSLILVSACAKKKPAEPQIAEVAKPQTQPAPDKKTPDLKDETKKEVKEKIQTTNKTGSDGSAKATPKDGVVYWAYGADATVKNGQDGTVIFGNMIFFEEKGSQNKGCHPANLTSFEKIDTYDFHVYDLPEFVRDLDTRGIYRINYYGYSIEEDEEEEFVGVVYEFREIFRIFTENGIEKLTFANLSGSKGNLNPAIPNKIDDNRFNQLESESYTRIHKSSGSDRVKGFGGKWTKFCIPIPIGIFF